MVAAQPDHCFSNLLRVDQAFDWLVGSVLTWNFGTPADAPDHRSAGDRGTNGVHTDSEISTLQRSRPGEPNDTLLTNRIPENGSAT
jgi:hypothetical protein